MILSTPTMYGCHGYTSLPQAHVYDNERCEQAVKQDGDQLHVGSIPRWPQDSGGVPDPNYEPHPLI